jgi:hypothetical protein
MKRFVGCLSKGKGCIGRTETPLVQIGRVEFEMNHLKFHSFH